MICSYEDGMTHTHLVEHHRNDLLQIVAALLALVGGRLRLPQQVRINVLRVLRPAEAAVRRLIFVVAKHTAPALPIPRTTPQNDVRKISRKRYRRKTHTFVLYDSMPPMNPARRAHRVPRIWSISPIDPTINAVFALHREAFLSAQRDDLKTAQAANAAEPINDGLVDASRLTLRLEAVTRALSDLPRQAQRLLRWTARRTEAAQHRPTYTSPIRPGSPPGKREHVRHEVEHILHACHALAHDARFNTS
jgi:hypothetical protein